MPQGPETGPQEATRPEPTRQPSANNGNRDAQPTPKSSQACDECRNRKVRCNRQLPECSNCVKAKIRCGFSARAKRINRKSLANDLAGVNERLSSIDGATSQLTKRLDELTALVSASAENSSTPAGASTPRRIDFSFLHDHEVDDITTAIGDSSDSEAESSHLVVVDDSGVERSYGPFSTYALFVGVKRSVEKFLSRHSSLASSPGSRRGSFGTYSSPSPSRLQSTIAEIQRKYEAANQAIGRLDDSVEADGEPPGLPPRSLLEASLEYYFDQSCLKLVIFQKETIARAIEQQYAPGGRSSDCAWISCFNSLIVLSLSCKSKMVRNFRSLTHHSSDEDLLATLLINSKRAIAMIEMFKEPRLVNLQALFLLALVARSYFHYSVFERIFDQSCQLAKFMGLQEGHSSRNLALSQKAERRSLIWALLAVDKQRVFIKGSPPHIYMFECNISMPRPTSPSPVDAYLSAHLQMVCLMEEIYKHLYSPKARKLPRARREECITVLDRQLQSWLSRNQQVLDESNENPHARAILRLQLKYIFFTTRITTYRCSSSGSNERQRLEDSRAALTVIQTLSSRSHLLNGGLVALERLFSNYSPVAFCDLFDDIMARPEADRSVEVALLSTVTNVLGLLAHPNFPESYCARVHRRFAWCSEIARALVPIAVSANGSPRSSIVFPNSTSPNEFQAPVSGSGQYSPTDGFKRSNSLDFSPFDESMPNSSFGSRSGSMSSNAIAFATSGSSFGPVLSNASGSADFSSDGTMNFGLSSRNSTSGIMTPDDGASFAGSLGRGSGMTPLAAQMDMNQFGDGAHSFTSLSFDAKHGFDFDGKEAMGDPLFEESMIYEN